jgi:hypothetical protein
MEPLFVLKVQAGAFVGALIALVIQIVWQRGPAKPRRLGGLVLLGGLIGAGLVQYGVPTSPFGADSLRSNERLFWLMVAALPLVLIAWRHVLIPLALVTPLVITNGFHDWSLADGAWVGHLAVPLGLVVLVQFGDGLFRARPGKASAMQLGLWAGLISAAIGATGSQTYALWMGGMGVAFGLSVLWAWRKWNAGLIDGGSLALWTGAFVWLATSYSELKGLDALLIVSALPLSLISRAVPLKPKAQAILGWVVLLAPFVVAGVRIALAWESDPYADYY